MSKADPAQIIIHFDVPQHYLLTKDYIIALDSFKISLEEFNKQIFENQLEYEFLTIGVEQGSFKVVLGILWKSTKYSFTGIVFAGGLISFVESQFFQGLYKGITGREINLRDLGEDAGILLRDLAIGIYTTTDDKLQKIIPQQINLDKALKAKNDFYKMCSKNSNIRAIGFSDKNEFPIKRSEFPYYLSHDIIRAIDSIFIIHNVIIISPVDKDMNKKWHFVNTKYYFKINAFMQDEKFKKDFLNGKYPLKQSKDDDRMTILVEYKRQMKNGDIKRIGEFVHTVYSFNDIEIQQLNNEYVIDVEFKNNKNLPMANLWDEQE